MTAGFDISAPGGQLTLTLARFLVRPTEWIGAGRAATLLGALSDTLTGPILVRARGAELARRLDLAGVHVPPGLAATLDADADAAEALRFALAPEDHLLEGLRRLGAVLQHGRLRSAVLKAERSALHAAFGRDAVEAGLRQGASLYPAVVALGDPARMPSPDDPLAESAEVAAAWLATTLSVAAEVLRVRLGTPPVDVLLDSVASAQVARLLRVAP